MTASSYKFDSTYMDMAIILSNLSRSWRKKVGCLIVSYNGNIPQIVSDGVNGTEVGSCNECEDENGNTYSHVIHAEENALRKLGDKFNLKNCTAYVTFQPCPSCAEKLVKAGISRVVYFSEYKDRAGEDYLNQNGVEVVKLSTKEITVSYNKKAYDYSGYLRSKGKSEKDIGKFVIMSKKIGIFL